MLEPYNAYVFTIHGYKDVKYGNGSVSAAIAELFLPLMAVNLPDFVWASPINLNDEY